MFLNSILSCIMEKREKINKKNYLEQLKKRGMKVGDNLYFTGRPFDWGSCFLIKIGNDVTISSNVTILAHDATTKRRLGYSKAGRVEIGNRAFIGAGSIILPGVTIGDDVIVGAGTVVTKDIACGKIVCGNPAREMGITEEYMIRNENILKKVPVLAANNITDITEFVAQVKNNSEKGIGFVE